MERERYMISDASNRIQVEAHVLRYWEEELELDVPRNEMGHRYYTEENIRQFEQIKKLKAEGFQLKAIKMLIHNPAPANEETAGDGEEAENDYNPEGMKKTELTVSAADAGQPSTKREEPLSKLEQFQLMMNEIVCSAIAENNQALGSEIASQVEERILKEMNYLMRDREEREEERFRRLDEAIRSRQRRPKKEKRKIFHTPIHKVEEMG